MPLKNAVAALILCFCTGQAVSQETRKVVTPHVTAAIKFTENNGQWEKQVLSRAFVPGGALFVERDGLTFHFYDRAKLARLHMGSLVSGVDTDFSVNRHAYKMRFENAEPTARLEKQQRRTDYDNYFIGKDPSRWRSNVRNYSQLFLRGIYPGIDYELLAASGGAKYNFHVKPGGDPNRIRIRFEGVNDIKIVKGELVVRTSVNEVVEKRPYAYQVIDGETREVPCRFRYRDGILGFDLPRGYDNRYELVIDPVLVFAAQIGTPADNFGMTATFDPAGNLYSGGTVYNPGYPFVLGSYNDTLSNSQAQGMIDVFVTKYNSSGTALIYSTYLGGAGSEVCSSLIVDSQGNLCLYGATGSANFPVTQNASDTTFNGGTKIGFQNNGTFFAAGTDIYVTKFNISGSALLGSTYFGGSGNDGINYLASTFNVFWPPGHQTPTAGYDSLCLNYGDQFRGEIQIDSLDNIYVCSSTRSSDMPVVNGFDNSLGGAQDAVVIKFDPSLSGIMYSTYLGGAQNECGNGIFVTPAFEIYVTGGTASSDFPGTSVGHSTTYNGGKGDGFITHIAATGSMVRSTYVGTSNYDNSFLIQCDKNGDVYVYGQSLGNFPVQARGALPVYSVTNTHQFIACYNTSLSSKLMSTVFGSKTHTFDISPSAFAIDQCNGNIYLSGWGGSVLAQSSGSMSGMPILAPTQANTTGFDFYLMALKPHAAGLLYGSYFGGATSREHVDGGTSRFDRKGIIYQSVCAGCLGEDDFPRTNGAWPCPGSPSCPNQNPSFNCNNGVFRINFDLQEATASISTQTNAGCAPLTVTLVNTTPGTSYEWNLGNGNTTSVIASPIVTFPNPGTHSVSLFVRDTTMCVTEDSTIIYFTVHPQASPQLTVSAEPCSVKMTGLVAVEPGSTGLQWNFGDGATSGQTAVQHNYTSSGIYTITVSAISSHSCPGSNSATISVLDFRPGAAPGGSLCNGSSLQLFADGGTEYNWQPPLALDAPTSPSPVATPAADIVYTVTVSDKQFGQTCTATFTAALQVMPQPTTSFVFSVHPCGGQVDLTDESLADIVSWAWNFSGDTTSSEKNPSHYFETGGIKTITLQTTNIHGCTDTVVKALEIVDAEPFISGPVNICIGQNVELYAGGGYEYRWTPEESLEQPFLPKTVAMPTVNTTYSVLITTGKTNTVTSLPCEFTLTTHVKVSELSRTLTVKADASPTVVVKGNSTRLVYTGDPGAYVMWLPHNSTSPATGYTVTATPDKPTTYTAVARREACGIAIPVPVDVYSNLCIDSEVFIPNTFTPNGDGSNDLFRVRGLSVDEVYFAVFNRWGEKVFETNRKDNGWDGRYEGKDVDVGVFGWYLKVKCFNGEETFLKGNVTLIR